MTDTESPFFGPLFIVGMPRSGTKLLREMIDNHPRVAALPIETEFLPYWVKQWDRYGDLSRRSQFSRFGASCQKFPFFIYLAERGTQIDTGAWFDRCHDFSPAGVFEGLARTALGISRQDSTIWADKSPSYLTHIGLLDRLFPEARVIHIVRDVRDYCLSINKAWGKNMIRAAQRWSDDVSFAHSTGSTLGPRFLELRYEELLEHTVEAMRRVCAFLSIPYQDDLISLTRPTENLGDTKGVSGIVRSNVNKFRSEMKPATRTRIERISGEMLLSAGYQCEISDEFTRNGRWRMRYYQLLDGINLIAATARERGLAGALRFIYKYYLISGNRQRPDDD
jgi:hypothetical protein